MLEVAAAYERMAERVEAHPITNDPRTDQP
jgi:hypothetical protein